MVPVRDQRFYRLKRFGGSCAMPAARRQPHDVWSSPLLVTRILRGSIAFPQKRAGRAWVIFETRTRAIRMCSSSVSIAATGSLQQRIEEAQMFPHEDGT
jgi:hypothetical protein